MKKNNITSKIYEAFTQFDPDQRGLISLFDFKEGLQQML